MGLIDNCKKFFKTKDLYEVLNVKRDASLKELKKAYHGLSLAVHPDRVGEAEKALATQKFQVMSQAYFILSDAEKRAVYDETGMVDDENTLSGDKDWADYWRQLFPKITTKDIDNYLAKYRGSKEEEDDLVENYKKYSGNPDRIYAATIGYDHEEEPRYKEILQKHIKQGTLEAFRSFTHESKAKAQARKRKLESEAKEAQEAKHGMEESLEQAIALRQEQRKQNMDSFLSRLEEKYAPKQSSKKKTSKRK